jgi:prolyl-tRNA synthetase
MGGLIMTHSDDDGLVLPPNLAPIQVVIVPIPKPDPELNAVSEKIKADLIARGISVKIDLDDKKRPGFKFAEYEMMGIPVRIGIGNRDLANGVVEIARRDTKEKMSIKLEDCAISVEQLLKDIQQNLKQKALDFRTEHTTDVNTWEEFKSILDGKGGFIRAHWDGTTETELKIKELTKATIRCIPIDQTEEPGLCVLTGKPSTGRVLFARAY